MTRPAAPATRPCILLVEDDASIREYLELGFGYEGFQVLHAANGSDALTLFERERPGVVVLDVGLPGLDGFAVLRAIRERSATPVLMLTARDGVEDRIQGLKEGADDYLVKPFHFGELVARVQAVLRRTQPDSGRMLTYADLSFDTQLREVQRGGRRLDLTPRATDLLETFLRHPERAMSKSVLLDHVWGADFMGDDNIVEVYVRQLRRALGEPELIQTVRGAGYALRLRS
ncbi:response regulator transcription factor [Deinococcus ruber]|uniref:DNA-binding response regulator n=1 Tax=Deinococcus ruber TaxID=1848197 RepID=A0A918BZA0_9DEIO|nr:response regulator transcription factor [Deinococcus ruber]GGQ96476.1 DNA-binding response regulator [Deinococcus ruber]